MSTAPQDRRLAAEARAVEEGHRAFRQTDYRYKVVSDTFWDEEYRDLTYVVEIVPSGGVLHFRCSCPNRRSRTPLCKHTQLVARRLEREGRAVLDSTGTWVDPTYEAPPLPDDSFSNVYLRG